MATEQATPTENDSPPVLALIRDLMFAPRVSSAGSQLGVPVKIVRDSAALRALSGRRLIVDLALPGALDAAAAWRSAGADGQRTVIAFAAHVDTETIRRAKEMGIDRVLTRGQFVQVLGEVLRG